MTALPQWAELPEIKLYLPELDSSAFDNALQTLARWITASLIADLDNDAIISTTPVNTVRALYPDLVRACAMQTAYEWKRRKDLGLSAAQYPDGSISKMSIDEWLSTVKEVIWRHSRIQI